MLYAVEIVLTFSVIHKPTIYLFPKSNRQLCETFKIRIVFYVSFNKCVEFWMAKSFVSFLVHIFYSIFKVKYYASKFYNKVYPWKCIWNSFDMLLMCVKTSISIHQLKLRTSEQLVLLSLRKPTKSIQNVSFTWPTGFRITSNISITQFQFSLKKNCWKGGRLIFPSPKLNMDKLFHARLGNFHWKLALYLLLKDTVA